MATRVFVSGVGVVSALGFDAGENGDALLQERSGIRYPNHLITRHKDFYLGEVKASNPELSDRAGIRYKAGTSRTILLGIIAAREAIANAELEPNIAEKSGFINGTSVGGMDISERLFKSVVKGESVSFKDAFYGHDCGHSTQWIAQFLKLKGYTSTISTACSSSANAIMQAGRMVRAGKLNTVVAGGTDALSLFTLNGFNSLKILDPNWCKPFDKERKGLNLGEGAAFLVLESEASLTKRKAKPLAELVGFGNANDAFHQTASSPEGNGAYKAMAKAFEIAGISPDAIDYVNAHGTGTDNNDQSESLALQRIFQNQIPAYSSTKAYTGHTLAAAGAIEAVFSLMSIQEQKLFPSLNISQPMDVIGPPVRGVQPGKVRNVLSNSFGFGGNCTSLIFSDI